MLVLTSGDRRLGLVEDSPGQPDKLIFIDSSGRTTIDRSRVANIIREPRAQGLIAIGNQMFEKGLLQDALDYYQQAQRADPELDRARELIAATEAELDRRAGQERRQQMLEISQHLRQARDLIENNEFERAQNALDEAEKLRPSETQTAELKTIRIRLLLEWGRERLDRLDREGAAEKFQAVLALAPQHVQAINELIALWEDDRTKTEQVRQLLERRLQQNQDDTATIKLLADIAFRERQFEQALPLYRQLYEKSPAAAGPEVEQNLQNILQTLRDRAASEGQLELASTYHKELMEKFPETDPTLLDVYDYRMRMSKLQPDDEQGWLDLAQWAAQKDRQEAYTGKFRPIDLYKKVLEINPENEQALRAYRSAAREELALANEVYLNGDYYVAKSMADEIRRDFPMAEQVALEAQELTERANVAITQQRRRNEEAAEELLESANYYYQQARYNEQLHALPLEQRRQLPTLANPRQEAIKYYSLAIRTYQQVIALGPNLPQVRSGEVGVKLNEAQAFYRRLRSPIDYGLPLVPSR